MRSPGNPVATDARLAPTGDLEDFFENGAVGLHLVGGDGTILRANRAELDLLGYEPEAYIGRNIKEFHADEPVIADILVRLGRGEKLDKYPARLKAADGSFRHVLITSSAFFENGRFINTRCFTIDVTEQKRVDDALRQSHQMLEAVVETNPECVIVVAEDGRVLRINEAGRRLVGQDRAADPSLRVFDLVAPEDRAPWREQHDRVCRGERLYWEFDLVDAAGLRRRMETHGAPLPLANGGVAHLALTRDITDRTRHEHQLRDSERRLRELLEALPAAIYTTDAEGYITFFNEAAAALAGRVPEIGSQWCVTWKLYLPDGTPLPHDQCPMAVALKEQRPVRGAEAIAERPDGTRVPFIPYPTPLRDASGRVVGAVNMLVDITDRKAAEILLQESQARLEERVEQEVAAREQAQTELFQAQKLEAIGQLTGGAAHDFNNLLAAILGNLELLGREALSPKGNHLIEAAIGAAEKGAMLTNQLLAYARRQTLTWQSVNLRDLVQGLEEMVRRTLGGLVEVRTEMPGNLWAVATDPTQLELAVLNLAINARDAMPEGGTLRIIARNTPLQRRQVPDLTAGDYVLIRVEDNGIGMPAGILAKATDPFFTTKEVGKGSGLGLSQVYGLVKQCRGALRIESEPGRGTRVLIWLPRTMAGPNAIVAASADTSSPRPGKLLVVDDDTAVRAITADLLRDAGYDVEEAADARAGLDRLDADDGIELALVDYAMPLVSGRQFVEEAQRRRPDLAVIYVTGYTAADALVSDKCSVLRKPFRRAELLRRVEEAWPSARPGFSGAKVVAIRATGGGTPRGR